MRSVTRAPGPWLVLSLLSAGCGHDEGATPPEGPAEVRPAPAESAPAAVPEPSGPPKRIFAKRFVVNVRTGPDEEAPRIGYLRAGAVLRATTAEPVGSEGCRGGWYELTTGGFVCNGRDVIAFDGDRLPEVRAAQPDLEAKLPYQYGYARRDGVPVYRNLPTDEEAAEYEGYRIPGREPPASEAEPQETGSDDAEAEETGSDDAEAEGRDAPSPRDAGTPRGDTEGSGGPASSEHEGAEEQAPQDAGPPTLESLMADDEESILLRRMMRGFYVSLDRELRIGRRRYWRTQQNEYIPYHMLGMAGGSDFAGVVLDGEERALPLGWILSRRTLSYLRRDDGRLRRGPAPGYHYVFRIVGRETIRDRDYLVGGDGRLYRADQVRQPVLAPRPEEVGPDEKWIDVDLERQTLVAYEGDTPVFVTLVSTGRIRREGVPDLDHRTPTGTYRISAKHLATTMDGDNAFDGPYSIQDVPYVMYYEQGYALHMAFWHDAFGRPKSHGCVNLSPADAKWIFRWTEPPLPEGWHGVYPTEERPGTLIRIRGETPRG